MTAQQIARGGTALVDAIGGRDRAAAEVHLDELVDECNRLSETSVLGIPSKALANGDWRAVAAFACGLLDELYYHLGPPGKQELDMSPPSAGDDDASLASLAGAIQRCRALAESE